MFRIRLGLAPVKTGHDSHHNFIRVLLRQKRRSVCSAHSVDEARDETEQTEALDSAASVGLLQTRKPIRRVRIISYFREEMAGHDVTYWVTCGLGGIGVVRRASALTW